MNRLADEAIVLSRVDYGERDRILTLFCKNQGKVRALAKSVRSAKSKLAGGIELFSESQVSLVEGKSGLYVLTSSRLKQHFAGLVRDLDKTMLAYGLLKTIDKISEDSSGQDYYQILLASLKTLDDPKYPKELVQLWFSLQVLKLSGHAPNLDSDAAGNKLPQAESYAFDYDKQCFTPKESSNFTSGHIKLFRLCSSRTSPPNVILDEDVILQSAKLANQLLSANVL